MHRMGQRSYDYSLQSFTHYGVICFYRFLLSLENIINNNNNLFSSSWFVWNGTLPKALYDGSVMGRLLEYKEYMVLPRVLISPL